MAIARLTRTPEDENLVVGLDLSIGCGLGSSLLSRQTICVVRIFDDPFPLYCTRQMYIRAEVHTVISSLAS